METSKYKRAGNIISALGALIAIFSIVYFIIAGSFKEKEIRNLNIENQRLIEQAKADSLKIIQIRNLISDYISTVQSHDYEKFSSFFGDSIIRFFLLENVSSKDTYYQMKWYWNKYPYSSINFNEEMMTIEKIDSAGYLIFIPSINKKSQPNSSLDILSEIRINNDMKIYYIRDYISDKGETPIEQK